jgi:hypothetical protein
MFLDADRLKGRTPNDYSLISADGWCRLQLGSSPKWYSEHRTTGNSNGDTDFCRWDPTGLQWIFNRKTNTSYRVGDTYKIQVFPNDGSEHDALISIK